MINKSRRLKRESFQSMFFSYFLGGLVLIVIIILVVSNLKIGQRRADLTAQLESLREEVDALEQEKANLQAKASQGTDQDFLEKEARERFNLKKPGEEVITVIPPEQEQVTTTEETGKSWWNIF
ncbi:MAG: septum formation initiator family protein [Candidatus Parcubacteria bacterium]|nr:septum formation initiator family protein [Candidatus Parcubacteria bacterium]